MEQNSSKPEYDLPFSPAAERNKSAILEKLQLVLKGSETVLEIGGGTGQHAVYFAEAMPGLLWIPSEVPERLMITNALIAASHIANINKPIALDVNHGTWPALQVDVVYTANTVHIMSWATVQKMITGVAKLLESHALFIIYGPFKYEGDFTSESNKMFDSSLKLTYPEQGIRDFEAVERLANEYGMQVVNDFEMPANNRLLVFKKQ